MIDIGLLYWSRLTQEGN